MEKDKGEENTDPNPDPIGSNIRTHMQRVSIDTFPFSFVS
jgi:hypothetical protein